MRTKFLLLFVFSTAIMSCGDQTNNQDQNSTYKCPMECEGDKVYSEPGKCPICEMDLQNEH